jgi:predicted transcriptional regulator of viral defense system
MAEELDPPDRAIARIAARQHGVASIRQLHAAGLSGNSVLNRIRAGRLHRIHRGVYAVGYRGASHQSRWMAAVLACGAGAALSHRSAAAHWGLLPPVDGRVDVSVSTRGGRAARVGIRLHRSRSLTSALVVKREGIPVTTPARTIADLRRVAPAWQWRRAVRQAEIRGLKLEHEALDGRFPLAP